MEKEKREMKKEALIKEVIKRLEMIDVEDPLWEYGYPLKRVLIDNQTGETYDEVGKLVGLLNELETKCHKLEKENEELKKSEKINTDYAEQIVEENQNFRILKNDLRREKEQLQKENEQLRKQVKSSETTSDATSNYNAHLESKITTLEKENEQLRKQIQNYEQLISNSYVGEEETLDGFVGKYVIWEDELQKYKNKNEMIDNG